jgi:CheY-like chemotaxis protein
MATVVLCSQLPVLRRNLLNSLEANGHVGLEVDGSIALVSLCLKRKVDLIVIDSELDYLSAPNTIRCLRVTKGYETLPIVALGHTIMQLHEAMAAGANRAIAKPIETSALMQVVDLLVPRARAFSHLR